MDKTIIVTIDQLDLVKQKIADADSKLKELVRLINEITEMQLKITISKLD